MLTLNVFEQLKHWKEATAKSILRNSGQIKQLYLFVIHRLGQLLVWSAVQIVCEEAQWKKSVFVCVRERRSNK